MTLINKHDVNQIFASQAPVQDVPAQFNNYPKGWDESRKNNGKPTIKQSNYLQKISDEKVLWIHQNGASLPYDSSIEYAEGAVTFKDGALKQKQGENWINASVTTIYDYSGFATLKTNKGIILVEKEGINGTFYLDASDTTSASNGGTVFLDGANRRWKRVLAKQVYFSWFEPATYTTVSPISVHAKLQSALNVASSISGTLFLGGKSYYLSSVCYIYSNTTVDGEDAYIYQSNQAFRSGIYTADQATTGGQNFNITLRNITFDGMLVASGAFVGTDVNNLTVSNCRNINYKKGGITTVYVNVATGINKISNNRFSNITQDAPDYGIILIAIRGGSISDVFIRDSFLSTDWGSAISLEGSINNTFIDNVNFDIKALYNTEGGTPSDHVGIGLKVWSATESNPARGLKISNLKVTGRALRTEVQAISIAGYMYDITITNYSASACSYGIYANFLGTQDELSISNMHVYDCNYGIYGVTSSNPRFQVSNSTFKNVETGLNIGLANAIISSCKFVDVSLNAINAPGIGLNNTLIGCSFLNIGRSAVLMSTSGGNFTGWSISGNQFIECGTSANNTYSVLSLNTNDHVITGNSFRNTGTNRPKYILGGLDVSANTIVTSNFLYGAGSGYYPTPLATNVIYANNRERGL